MNPGTHSRIRAASARLGRICERGAALVAAVAFTVAIGGCAGEDRGEPSAGVSDTTAFRTAIAVEDTTARIGALETFLAQYPQTPLRATAAGRLHGLLEARDPERAETFAREGLKTEQDPGVRGRLHYALYTQLRSRDPGRLDEAIQALRDDPAADAGVYNMVAWDLVEREERLDDAVSLADIGVERAPDNSSRAMVLDTKGWALYLKGDLPAAITVLEEAVSLEADPSLQEHLAEAYEKAGRKADARDVIFELMVSQEDPKLRQRLEGLIRDTGGSPGMVFRQLDARREAAAVPAPDFTLKDYEGREVRLSDFRGQVVLLNFWHPT